MANGQTQAHAVKSSLQGSRRFLFFGQRLFVLHIIDLVVKNVLEGGTQIAAP